MSTQRQRAEKDKERILRMWAMGDSIAAISRTTSVNRNAVRALLEAEGVRGQQPDAKGNERTARREEVRRWVREHPGCTLATVAAATGQHPRTTADYLDGTPEAALLIESRAKSREYTRDEMLAHLRETWMKSTTVGRADGLSKARYDKLAGPDRPSTALFEKRFPSWSAACRAAGIPSKGAGTREYTRKFSLDDLIAAVAGYIDETGDTSFSGYTRWAKEDPGRPSGSLVITRFERWSNMRRAVVERNRAA